LSLGVLTLLAKLILKRTIPVTNQDTYFRVLERYQFKAVLCNNGRSLIKSTNEEVMLLKRFFDGSKNNLCRVIKINFIVMLESKYV